MFLEALGALEKEQKEEFDQSEIVTPRKRFRAAGDNVVTPKRGLDLTDLMEESLEARMFHSKQVH